MSDSPQQRLEQELKKLKASFEFGHELRIVWAPETDSSLSGEVRGNAIYIYETGLSKAIRTLHHEFVDFCLSSAIQPFKEVTNLLIQKVNADAYHRKEKIVEALAKFLDRPIAAEKAE